MLDFTFEIEKLNFIIHLIDNLYDSWDIKIVISSLCDLLIITQLNHLNVTGVCVGLEVFPSILISPSIKDSWVSKDQFVVSNPAIVKKLNLAVTKSNLGERKETINVKFKNFKTIST